MANFEFIQNKITGRWIISVPRRAQRPDDTGEIQHNKSNACPFCLVKEPIIYETGGVKVLNNKFPFAPIHEVVIHSSDHNKNFGELSVAEAKLVFETFRERYNAHKAQGQVYIFHNRGEQAGESLAHPHSQIAVIPENFELEIPPLDNLPDDKLEMSHYYIFCPISSEWPDEVWIAPKSKIKNNISKIFGESTDEEIKELAQITTKLVQVFQKRHGEEFPYNFYIYPKENWYLRFIPRVRILGGFEVGTGVSVNTQDPKETLDFLRKNIQ